MSGVAAERLLNLVPLALDTSTRFDLVNRLRAAHMHKERRNVTCEPNFRFSSTGRSSCPSVATYSYLFFIGIGVGFRNDLLQNLFVLLDIAWLEANPITSPALVIVHQV